MDRETFEILQSDLKLLEEDVRATRSASLVLLATMLRIMRLTNTLDLEQIELILDLASERCEEARARAHIEKVREIVFTDAPTSSPPNLRIV